LKKRRIIPSISKNNTLFGYAISQGWIFDIQPWIYKVSIYKGFKKVASISLNPVYTVDGQLENSLREPWAKAVENAPRLRAALTALTHFFNLPTTPTSTDYAN
jgi:hypothetical protein